MLEMELLAVLAAVETLEPLFRIEKENLLSLEFPRITRGSFGMLGIMFIILAAFPFLDFSTFSLSG
jgi:hypothetical protein